MSRLKELIEELCPDGVGYRRLGEVGAFIRGSGLQKKDFTEYGPGCIHYGQLYTTYGLFAHETKTHCPESLYAKLKKAETGDLVIATTSENEEDVCKAMAWLGDEPVGVSGDAYVFKHSLDPMFVSYFFNTSMFRAAKMQYITGTKVLRVNGEDMARIRIPVPPIEIQREIVRILDAMQELEEALNDEYEKRRKQFAYYRHSLIGELDKSLLTELDEVVDFQLGKMLDAEKNKGEYRPYLRNINVQQGRFDLTDIQDMRITEEEREKFRVRSGDILMCEGGVPGRSAIWRDSETEIYFQKALHRLRCDGERVMTDYCYLAISDAVENGLYDETFTGSAIKHAPARVVKKWKIPVPDNETQRRLSEALESMIALYESVESELIIRRKQFEYYRDKLLDFPEKAV